MRNRASVTVEEVAKAINLFPEDWKGKCMQIASAMVEKGLVEGVVVYGHWIGPFASGTIFSDRAKMGFTHHGWVSTPGNKVIDPTRWVFENVEPYIFQGDPANFQECPDFESEDDGISCMHCGHITEEHEHGFFRHCKICKWPYDEGGQQWAEAMHRNRPLPEVPAKSEDRKYALAKALTPKVRAQVFEILGEKATAKTKVTHAQLHYVATCTPDMLGSSFVEIYDAVCGLGHAGLIPTDFQAMANRRKAG